MSIIAIGGGKGGVGRTLVAGGLAVFLAQLGKRVLLVDGHPQAPQIAATFGVARWDGRAAPWVVPPQDPRGSESSVPNVRVLTPGNEATGDTALSLRKPQQLATHAAADYTLLDLGAGVSTSMLDAMLGSDAILLVVSPEPASVEAFYRTIRHLYTRSLTRALRAYPVELRALQGLIKAEGGPPAPLRAAEEVAKGSSATAEIAWSSLQRMRVRLVVNNSRSRAELELGEGMTTVCRQRFGVHIEYLGHIEYDEAALVAAKHRRPLLVEAPGAKASRNLERIARRLLALEAGRTDRAPSGKFGPPERLTHYDVLGVDRGVGDEELRRAYRRMRELLGPDSLAIAGLFTAEELSSATARVEEARDVLLDPARRRPYDLTITPPEAITALLQEEREQAQQNTEQELLPRELPNITPETEFTGELLRLVREAQNIELKDVAARTKISLANLRAIETEDFTKLPPEVYLRGFVSELARFLKLDPEQVARTYLRRFRYATEPAPRSRRG